MKKIIKKNRVQLISAAAGAIGGFLYWRFIGCTSGTCAIKSVWYLTSLWGAAVGYLAGDLIQNMVNKINTTRKDKKI